MLAEFWADRITSEMRRFPRAQSGLLYEEVTWMLQAAEHTRHQSQVRILAGSFSIRVMLGKLLNLSVL